jgi:hypothetical protein
MTEGRTRGGCLTTFLVLMILFNVAVPAYYLVAGHQVRRLNPNFPTWGPTLFVLMGVINLICAIGVWRWRRWGVIGYGATALCFFTVPGQNPVLAILGLLGPVVLSFLVSPQWSQME